MEITKIILHGGEHNADTTILNALITVLGPFESLTRTGETVELAHLMVDYVGSGRKYQGVFAGHIIGILGSTPGKAAEAKFSDTSIALVTPGSRTRIQLRWGSGDNYYLEVNFGAKGSKRRSFKILLEAEYLSIKFNVHGKEGRYSRKKIVSALIEYQEAHLKWLEGLPADSRHKSKMPRAKAKMDVLEMLASRMK